MGLPDSVLAVLAFLVGLAAIRALVRLIEDPRGLRLGGRITYLCAVAAAGLGVAVGLVAGRTARAACPAALLTGDAVEVRATVQEAVLAGATRARLSLSDATIRHGARQCAAPGVTAYASHVRESIEPGDVVVVRGEWMRSRHLSRRWPAIPLRLGFVSGRTVEREGFERRAGVLLELRRAASQRLRRRLPADVRSIGLALVLAERTDLEPRLRRRFAEAGLAHLLAISGLHVGIIAAGLVFLLSRAVPRGRSYPLAAAFVTAYVLAIGAPASAVRAGIVFAGLAIARARGVPARILDLTGAAAAAALVMNPLALLDPGFQLSFAGFGGVLLGAAAGRRFAGEGRAGARPSGSGARRRWVGLVMALAVGGGAFAATAPIVAWHFQQVAPVAVIAHLAATPLVALAVAALAGAILLPGAVAELAAGAATVLLRGLLGLTAAFAGLPWGHGEVAPPGPATWLAFALLLLAAVRYIRRRRALVPAAAAGMVLLAAPAVSSLADMGDSLMCSLDVGQGDAAVLRTSSGRWMVFDAGSGGRAGDAGRRVLVPRLLRGGARGVDLFVLSHPDLDHVGGAEALFDRYRVRRVLDSGDPLPKPAYARFLGRVVEQGSVWLAVGAGDRLRLDNVELTVLGPPRSTPGAESGPPAREANATSLSFRVRVSGGFTYLNTGDATAEEELDLQARWPADSLRADLLKVGHHGSRTSSRVGWLRSVRPAIAVISSGAGNAYGHPHPRTLARLDSAGVPAVWRTDRRGSLCVQIDRHGRWRADGEARWRSPSAPMARDLTTKKDVD